MYSAGVLAEQKLKDVSEDVIALLISVQSSDHTLKMRVCIHVSSRNRKFKLHLFVTCQAQGESLPKEQGHVVRLSVLLSVGCSVHARVWRYIPRTKNFDHLFVLAIPNPVRAAVA
jgi:hypothetical protein